VSDIPNADDIRAYFSDRLTTHGATPRGADWNSVEAQEARFAQLVRVCDLTGRFSILDYGCGYAALVDYLERRGAQFDYIGFDLLESMTAEAGRVHQGRPNCAFFSDPAALPQADYTIASGIFNIRLQARYADWTDYVLKTVHHFDRLSRRGFAFNLLTRYADPEYMRRDLYFADPNFYFDYCKRHFSRNVALLHDYELHDFTLLVRKTGKPPIPLAEVID
jgi:SAM-dependent methyltransferase